MKSNLNFKFKKHQKCLTFLKRSIHKQPILHNGVAGLIALESSRITSSQLDSIRLGLMRFLKKKGKIWINVFADIPVTKKASETRMGKGKGNIDYHYAPVKKNKVIIEVGQIDSDIASEALKSIQSKLPIKSKILKK